MGQARHNKEVMDGLLIFFRECFVVHNYQMLMLTRETAVATVLTLHCCSGVRPSCLHNNTVKHVEEKVIHAHKFTLL